LQERIILSDIDGCVLDWEFAFHAWAEAHGHSVVNKNLYDVTQSYGFSQITSDYLVRTFNSSAAIGFLPPLRDAQYYIKLLHEKYQYRFVAVTSMGIDPYAHKLRIRNLAKLFGSNTFKEVHFLDCGADKTGVLMDLTTQYQGAYWVEDKPHNATLGWDLGYKSLLMEHGHNMEYVGPARIVKNWKMIAEIVTGEVL
jgi:hypothetical protein